MWKSEKGGGSEVEQLLSGDEMKGIRDGRSERVTWMEVRGKR